MLQLIINQLFSSLRVTCIMFDVCYHMVCCVVLCWQDGMNAAGLAVAEQYIEAFGQLAKENNTVLLPANTGDIPAMVTSVSAACLSLFSRRIFPQGKKPDYYSG